MRCRFQAGQHTLRTRLDQFVRFYGGPGRLEQAAEHDVVHGKRQNGADQHGGRTGSEMPGALPRNDESLQEGIEPSALRVLKLPSERMLLERGINHQPEEVRVALVSADNPPVHRTQQTSIVSLCAKTVQFGEPPLGIRFAGFLFENRGVQLVLVRKMLEDERLGDACRLGELPRRRPPEAVLGEDAQPGLNQLLPAVLCTVASAQCPARSGASGGGDAPARQCGFAGSQGRGPLGHVDIYTAQCGIFTICTGALSPGVPQSRVGLTPMS